MSADKSKTLVRNTILLYARMVLILLVGLYTSRVVLRTLGIADYGIYNVVGGMVYLFSIITTSLSIAVSRFISVELGRGDIEKLKRVFASSVVVQALMAAVFLAIAVPVSYWFLNCHLNIPPDRMYASNWVLLFCLLSFAVNLMAVPFNSLIIAHEHMQTFAYVSILESLMKLVVVFLLVSSPIDHLITYAFLLFFVALLIASVYAFYCKRHFEETHVGLHFDRRLLSEISSFAGWNFLDSAVTILNNQGVTVLINLFFGVVMNAARGVAIQIDTVIKQFVTNFMTALNPQIMKSYAEGDMEYFNYITCKGSKFCYYLILIFFVPLYFEIESVLSLWLGEYPEYAPTLIRLTLTCSLVDYVSNPLSYAVWATGRIKRYSLWIGGIGVLVLPLSYVAYKAGLPVEWSYYVFIFIYATFIVIKFVALNKLTGFPYMRYVKEVLCVVAIVTAAAFVYPFVVSRLMEPSYTRMVVNGGTTFLITLVIIFVIGLTKSERQFVLKFLSSLVRKFFNMEITGVSGS